MEAPKVFDFPALVNAMYHEWQVLSKYALSLERAYNASLELNRAQSKLLSDAEQQTLTALLMRLGDANIELDLHKLSAASSIQSLSYLFGQVNEGIKAATEFHLRAQSGFGRA